MKDSALFTVYNLCSNPMEPMKSPLSVLTLIKGIKLLMKKIDTNLRGAIPMVEFLNYFGPKIKKFAQIE
jgi:hypothetical protein